MALSATKLSRHGEAFAVGASPGRAGASKHSTLASTYGTPGSRSRSGTKSRDAGQLQVVLPPALPIVFRGLSTINSFLASSSHNFGRPPGASPEGDEQSKTPEELPNYRIIHGVKYDAYPRNEVPYSMLYDTVTPENELHSYLLMRKLTENGAHLFSTFPHRSLSATLSTSAAGTVTGSLTPHRHGDSWHKDCRDRFLTHRQGHDGNTFGASAENTEVFNHNFVTQELPFPDNSFDYVRLNDAVVVIPRGRWDFVLSEAYRVLRPGGRLELIHDQLCFPFVGPEAPVNCTFAPSSREPNRNVFYAREAETGKGTAVNVLPPRYGKSPYENWEAEMQNCRVLEELYLEMLAQRYGVHPQPRGTLMDAIRRRFRGRASHVKVSNAYVCLPSRDFMERSDVEASMRSTRPNKRQFGISISIDWSHDKAGKTKNLKALAPPAPREFPSLTGLPPVLSKKAASLMGVVQLSPAGAPYQPPGVVVVRTSSEGVRRSMAFLPMSSAEIDMHSNKHIHSLLSAKLALEAHVEELQVKGKPTMSHEDLDEALWQYAMFRQKRFNWPEMDPFAYETESDGNHECGSEELKRLSRTQSTDASYPFDYLKSSK
ncbi:hypothetical protein EI94DRAFT_118944 [Lactarius quietus]|nr:hypothetical protein EI94DRAFT_118944 [Lactarius quietus]